jgi:hypothetical protein
MSAFEYKYIWRINLRDFSQSVTTFIKKCNATRVMEVLNLKS